MALLKSSEYKTFSLSVGIYSCAAVIAGNRVPSRAIFQVTDQQIKDKYEGCGETLAFVSMRWVTKHYPGI